MDDTPAQPLPVNPGSRARTRLAALAPVLALVLVVVAAWGGSQLPGRPAAPAPTGEAVAVVRGLPSPQGPQLSSEPSPSPSGSDRDGIPAVMVGLPVMRGAQVASERTLGHLHDGLVAVAGFLRDRPGALSCPVLQLTMADTFCHRVLALFPDPGPDGGSADIRSTTPFIGRVLPGTPLPDLLDSRSVAAGDLSRPVPVVLVGHFEDDRAPLCGPGHDWCRDDFVVEEVAWAGGEWLTAPLVIDPGIPGSAEVAAELRTADIVRWAAARGPHVLDQGLLGVPLLRLVDAAAGEVAAASGGTGPVWYLRTTASAGDRQLRVAWTVIDDATGLVLGTSDSA